ncbi:MAG: hypothetical protein R3266_05910 [Gemmatimonadota bacterium]|nr:hypothetical protein [Gemmatimonadota bacterium]
MSDLLARDELHALYNEFLEIPVLSVYLDADQHDPAERDAWRIALKQGIASERKKLESAGGDAKEELAALDRAFEHLRDAIGVADSSFLPGRGWAGFATEDGIVHAGSVPVPMPNLVRWERGLRAAPYLRVLKQARPVFLTIIDQRRAAIYRYHGGEFELVRGLHADTEIGDLTDIGQPKRASQRSGIRGKTGTDAAQAILEVATGKLMNRLASELEDLLEDSDGFLVLGGISQQISALEKHLPEALGGRTVRRSSLHFESEESELKETVEEAASELTSSLHQRLLESVMELARSNGRGCLGREDTEEALRAQRVRLLLVSVGLTNSDPDYADHLVGTAFGTNGAEAHILTRDPGERLDREAGGVGAALHY